jgi:hypothetical protein
MLPNVAIPSTQREHIEECSFSAITDCTKFRQFIVSTLNRNCLFLFNFYDRVNSLGQFSAALTFCSPFSYLLRVLFSQNRFKNI